MHLDELVWYCDDYLRIREVRDYPEALNGLQVGNSGTVARIAAAVDLCIATVRMAAEQRANFLIVHHGLFWGGVRPPRRISKCRCGAVDRPELPERAIT